MSSENKSFIEIDFPIKEVSVESAREKNIHWNNGHLSGKRLIKGSQRTITTIT